MLLFCFSSQLRAVSNCGARFSAFRSPNATTSVAMPHDAKRVAKSSYPCHVSAEPPGEKTQTGHGPPAAGSASSLFFMAG